MDRIDGEVPAVQGLHCHGMVQQGLAAVPQGLELVGGETSRVAGRKVLSNQAMNCLPERAPNSSSAAAFASLIRTLPTSCRSALGVVGEMPLQVRHPRSA
jgi:hypothetical protein